MKVVYEPGEKERLEKIYDQYGKFVFGDGSEGKMYGLTFKITNPAIAEYVLTGLLHNHLKDFDIGIEVQSIEFNTITMNRSELKNKLLECIDKLL